ncbi:MAG: sulfate reduction electron transfer complex DsrMKJOP subunit DsrM [Syntrophales bacterium]
MGVWFSLFAVLILTFIAFMGVEMGKLNILFGVVIPYAALIVFIVGVISRVVRWARSPVPFRITTVCGQQKSLPWIKSNNIESPSNTRGVLVRMALEVFLFRSLFRNTKVELRNDPRLLYGGAKWLWLAGLAFHWSFLVILIRHMRFFTEPVPRFVELSSRIDGMFEIGVPVFYLSGLIMLAAVTYLFLRRVFIPQLRYISLAADYFPLFLIIGVALSGFLMRHYFKVDILKVKELAIGLVSFHPVVPGGIGLPFYIHLFLVSVLLMYIPFSKLMHMGGVFLSPTRNLANNNRMKRHINPWNSPVKVHTYEEYEDEFRDKMKAVGIPVEKE